jgi:hypothetical protein
MDPLRVAYFTDGTVHPAKDRNTLFKWLGIPYVAPETMPNFLF